MAIELIKAEKITLPDLTFIGKQTSVTFEQVQTNNPLPAFWEKCFQDGTFEALEQTPSHIPDYVGLCVDISDEGFTYIIGMFKPKGADVPEDFTSCDIGACGVAYGLVRGGSIAEIAAPAWDLTADALTKNGWGEPDMSWCAEIYNCPRYTTPDENGLITLDYYVPIGV